MIGLLITVLVAGLIFYLVWYLINLLPLPAPFKQVAQVILVIIGILYLLGLLTHTGGLAPISIG